MCTFGLMASTSTFEIANVLNKLPKRVQPKAKSGLWEIYRAETKTDANHAFNRFIQSYQAKKLSSQVSGGDGMLSQRPAGIADML